MTGSELERSLIELTPVTEFFAYGLGRVDNLGSCSRPVFYAPKKVGREPEVINEVVFTVVVPTDQLPAMAALLVGPKRTNLISCIEAAAVAEHGHTH